VRRRQCSTGFETYESGRHLSHGDLLLKRPGERYKRTLHQAIWTLYPRWVVGRTGNVLGTNLFVEAVK